jgi:hypothetical protein
MRLGRVEPSAQQLAFCPLSRFRAWAQWRCCRLDRCSDCHRDLRRVRAAASVRPCKSFSFLRAQSAGHRCRRRRRNSGRSGFPPLDHELADGRRLRPDRSSPGSRVLLRSRARRLGINGQECPGRDWRHLSDWIFGRDARPRIPPVRAEHRSLHRSSFRHQPPHRTRPGPRRHSRRNERLEVISRSAFQRLSFQRLKCLFTSSFSRLRLKPLPFPVCLQKRNRKPRA